MVKMYLNFDTGYIHAKIIDEIQFDMLVELFKHNHIRFNYKTSEYMLEPNLKTKGLYETLLGYTKVDISEEDKDLIINSVYPPSNELKKVKLNIDKDLLEKNPPLIGKHPYENFQVEAIKETIKRNRIILDVEMRHGKSYISLMSIGTLFINNIIDRVFIVCRPEGVENFRLETLRFLKGNITENDIAVITTNNREIEDYLDKKIIITNYTTYRLICNYYQELRSKSKTKVKKPKKPTIQFDKWGSKRLILLDECQSMNNYDSIQSHYLHLYKDYFERRIIMSGSINYSFLQMYSLCKFLVPDRIPYCFSEWRDYVSGDMGRSFYPNKVQEFKESVIDKLMITYKDCIEQTEQYKEIISIAMTNKLRTLYQTACNQVITDCAKENNGMVSLAKLGAKFSYLSSITSDPTLKDPKWKFKDNPKLEVLDSLLDKFINKENRRIIIWCNHPSTINQLGEYYKNYKPLMIHGDEKTSIKRSERNEYLDKFRKDNSQKILICNYVLSTSISLTQCSINIYFDLPLNSDNFNQSQARIRGPLQKEETFSYYLMFSNSIDNYIYYDVLMRKEGVKNILSNKDNLDIADYKYIFNRDKTYTIEGDLR